MPNIIKPSEPVRAPRRSATHMVRGKPNLTRCMKFHIGELHHKFYWPLFFSSSCTVLTMQKQWVKFKRHRSHKTQKAGFHALLLSLFWFQVWPEQVGLISISRYFCTSQSFHCHGEGATRRGGGLNTMHATKKKSGRCNLICHMTYFALPNSKWSCFLRQKSTQRLMNAACDSVCVYVCVCIPTCCMYVQ